MLTVQPSFPVAHPPKTPPPPLSRNRRSHCLYRPPPIPSPLSGYGRPVSDPPRQHTHTFFILDSVPLSLPPQPPPPSPPSPPTPTQAPTRPPARPALPLRWRPRPPPWCRVRPPPTSTARPPSPRRRPRPPRPRLRPPAAAALRARTAPRAAGAASLPGTQSSFYREYVTGFLGRGRPDRPGPPAVQRRPSPPAIL